MLKERRVRRYTYDANVDVVHLELDTANGRGEEVQLAGLLVDARGHLVGVDLGGTGMDRSVAMLGPHEAVGRTVDAEVRITRAPDGEPCEIHIPRARALIRTTEANPYV